MKISAVVPTLLLGAALVLPASVLADEDHGVNNLFWSKCQVDEVATFSNRVHVRCAGIAGADYHSRYLASPTSNSAEAARLATLGTASFMSSRSLLVLIDLGKADAASYGCAVTDCRRPLEIRLQK